MRFRKSRATVCNNAYSEVKSRRLVQRAAYPLFLSLGRANLSRWVPHGTRIHSETVTHTPVRTKKCAGSYDPFPRSTCKGSKAAVNQLQPSFKLKCYWHRGKIEMCLFSLVYHLIVASLDQTHISTAADKKLHYPKRHQ